MYVHETTIVDFSEKIYTIIDIENTKLLYSNKDKKQFNIKLGELLRNSYYSRNLLIFKVDDNTDIKLIGYKQAFLFPYYQISKRKYYKKTVFTPTHLRNMITNIDYDKSDKHSKKLLEKTLYAIDGMLSYFELRNKLLTHNWSKKQFKQAFNDLGYKKTIWYRTKSYLRDSYLERYYLYMLARYYKARKND